MSGDGMAVFPAMAMLCPVTLHTLHPTRRVGTVCPAYVMFPIGSILMCRSQ